MKRIIENLERGLKKVSFGSNSVLVKKNGCGWFTIDSDNTLIYCVGETVNDLKEFFKNIDFVGFLGVAKIEAEKQTTQKTTLNKTIKSKKVNAGFYKGEYRGKYFDLAKMWLNDGSNDMWWFPTVEGVNLEPLPTKKAALRTIQYFINNPNEFK